MLASVQTLSNDLNFCSDIFLVFIDHGPLRTIQREASILENKEKCQNDVKDNLVSPACYKTTLSQGAVQQTVSIAVRGRAELFIRCKRSQLFLNDVMLNF